MGSPVKIWSDISLVEGKVVGVFIIGDREPEIVKFDCHATTFAELTTSYFAICQVQERPIICYTDVINAYNLIKSPRDKFKWLKPVRQAISSGVQFQFSNKHVKYKLCHKIAGILNDTTIRKKLEYEAGRQLFFKYSVYKTHIIHSLLDLQDKVNPYNTDLSIVEIPTYRYSTPLSPAGEFLSLGHGSVERYRGILPAHIYDTSTRGFEVLY